MSNEAGQTTPSEVLLTVLHHGKPYEFAFPTSSTIVDLSIRIAEQLEIPQSHQKFLVQKLGLLKPPFKDPDLPLTALSNKKITLLAPTAAEVSALSASIASAVKPRRSVIPSAQPARTRDWKRAKEDAEYTFHTLRPLTYLPNPERSLRFLERLRDDAGIRAAMRAHRFSVPLLTEMDPAAHTTASYEGVSRILGLNRNAGEVIELRLRTDAGDGYRDYKTIRKTLCHELAHNVHGPHDAKFWKLCKEIENEVARADWRMGGHTLSNEEFYEPLSTEDMVPDDHIDGGGWTGGEFVLGKGESESAVLGVEDPNSVATGQLSRREILARAAEARLRKSNSVRDETRAPEDEEEGKA